MGKKNVNSKSSYGAGDANITVVLLLIFMVFNVTLNNISVIAWRSVLLVEKTRPAISHGHNSSHNDVSSAPRLNRIQTHNVSGDRH
jgi:hypothetical protein